MKLFKNKNINYFFLVVLTYIVLSIIVDIILYYNTQFEEIITVTNKYHLQRASRYHIVDKNDNNYRISNVWFKGDFNRGDEYGMILKGNKYKVKGYGKRVPFLNMYKKIYNVVKI